MHKSIIYILILNLFINLNAQNPKKYSSSEIYQSIQKLNFIGSVLYVAAHPDDENTSMISYFSNSVHAETAYFSFTRGDGGQNLIGPELRELLGVIRTQELLQARRIDGGIQFFSRANDFGYSKTPEETFEFWNKNEVLGDLVYIIRKFQPDVIINRFDHRTPGSTHGHHTASAMLSVEAFNKAANSNEYTGQLIHGLKPWQTKRLFFNDSWFMYGSKEAYEKADQTKKFKIDTGVFYPETGLSNSEISALSRSRHSSQGFGITGSRGSSVEFIEPIEGGKPVNSVFEGIDTSWTRLKGGKEIGELLKKVEENFDFKNPSASVPDLLNAYKLIQKLEDSHWREIKTEAIKNIIIACSGLYLEGVSSSETAIAGETILVNFEAINRSNLNIKINSAAINGVKYNHSKILGNNQNEKFSDKYTIPLNQKPDNPYWLNERPEIGMYKVDDPKLIGLAETPSAFKITFDLEIEGTQIQFEKNLVYKFNDPAKGEVYKPFVIVPKASIEIEDKVLIFGDSNSKTIKIKVKSFTENLNGDLSLKLPNDWKVNPEINQVEIQKKEESKTYSFEITPPVNQSETELTAVLKIGNQTLDKELYEINYDHIPAQKILLPATSKIVRIDLKKKGNKIGYINGAGDSVADDLKQTGYEVEVISVENIQSENLKKYDAIVLGVRAFNVLPEMKYKNEILFDYVKNGGNLLVQYNVSRGQTVTDDIAPYPLKLSTNRVTDENSEVRFLSPDHPALNIPNKISQKDFEGWVQERGLYFPYEWSEEFTPVLSMNDKGEQPMNGSLLIAKYGKGYYIYTGLSFFRELPAGVPGAYRLLANLLSLGK